MAITFDKENTLKDEGVWASYAGSEFKLAHSGNNKFQRALSRLQAPHRRKIDKGSLDPVESKNIICKAMAEGLVLDWKNVVDSKGVQVVFDKDKCFTALVNNEDLREFIQEFALDLENFKSEESNRQGNV